jgi:hypothetical protein
MQHDLDPHSFGIREFQRRQSEHEPREHAGHTRRHRVADIYLGEFMRQFTRYAFRDAAAANGDDAADFRPQDLKTGNSWMGRYESAGTSGALRRTYFSGQ